MLASDDETGIPNDEGLAGTGAGGLFASGYLREEPLIDHLQDTERVAHLLTNKKKGVREEGPDGSHALTPGDGYRAIMAVTDTRLLYVVGDCEDGDAAFAVPYPEIERVKTGRSVLTRYVDVWTTEGYRYRFPVKKSVDVEPAAEYVDSAAIVWSRVETQLGRARKQLVEIEEAVAEGDHQAARAAVDRAREFLAEAKDRTPELSTDRSEAIWAHVETVEGRLTEAVLGLLESEADRMLAAANRQWRDAEYDRAYDSLVEARGTLERAADRAADHDLSAEADLRERCEDVSTKLDRLSESPLRRAEAAENRADSETDPAAAVAARSEALEHYRAAMVLDWGSDDHRFAGDSDTLREKVETLAADVVETRRALSADRRTAGDQHRADGADEQARQAYVAALEHLEDAHEIAEELLPHQGGEIVEAIEDVEREKAAVEAEIDWGGFEFVGDRD